MWSEAILKVGKIVIHEVADIIRGETDGTDWIYIRPIGSSCRPEQPSAAAAVPLPCEKRWWSCSSRSYPGLLPSKGGGVSDHDINEPFLRTRTLRVFRMEQ